MFGGGSSTGGSTIAEETAVGSDETATEGEEEAPAESATSGAETEDEAIERAKEQLAQQEGAAVDVVPSPDDVPSDLRAPVGVVVQTTQRRENLDAIVERIVEQGIEPEVKRTICFATRQRQDAAAELAGQVDAMVVIGGRNSSNTTRLAEICSAECPRAFHVESVDEISADWFAGCQTVGVTAGASTPESQITAVVDYLEAL